MKIGWKIGLKARTIGDNFLKKSLSSKYFTYQQIFEMLVPLIIHNSTQPGHTEYKTVMNEVKKE